MSEEHMEIVEEYSHQCRVVREGGGGEPTFHYEGPLGRVQTFASESKATLYADVQELMGGFREEKTGERGVPPSVARARHDVLVSYLACQPSMSVTWAARHFDIAEEEVRQYITMVRERAEASREDN